MTVNPKNPERLETILQAAAQLFARQGYHGTSAREIARLADTSENTLFRYFETKEDIFWAVLRSRFTGIKVRRDLLEGMAQGAAPEIVIPQILAQLVDTAILRPELLRLVAVAFLELNWKAEAVCQEYLTPIFSLIQHYLVKSIERGQVRNLDPMMVTAALAMTVMAHPELSRLLNGTRPAHSDSQEAIRAYTRFWLDVLIPSASDRARAASGVAASLPA